MTSQAPRRGKRLTLRIEEWPKADQQAWKAACRPSVRLKKGGAGSHLAPASHEDISRRYGRYLGFLRRTGRLDQTASAADQVTPTNVADYRAEFTGKISSVTAWNCIYKLRRAAQLLAPQADFRWLIEIEKDLEVLQEPRSKLNRFVYTEELIKAGLTLIVEAENFTKAPVKRARAVRDGLMLALLAANPIRLKNFAALEIGKTLQKIEGQWWISISARTTKHNGGRKNARWLPGSQLTSSFILKRLGPFFSASRKRKRTDSGSPAVDQCPRGTSASV
jgi:hypothetical protein